MRKKELKRRQEKKEAAPKIEEITDEEAKKIQEDIDRRKNTDSKEHNVENNTEKEKQATVRQHSLMIKSSKMSLNVYLV